MNMVCFPVSNSSNIISYTRCLAAQNNGEINILERTNPPLMMISQFVSFMEYSSMPCQ